MRCESCGIDLAIIRFIPEYKGKVMCSNCVVSELKDNE